MLPGTIMYVYLGSALKSLGDVAVGAPEGGTPQTVFFVAGLVMTIVATVVITRVARRALNEAVAEHRAPAEDGTSDAGSRPKSPCAIPRHTRFMLQVRTVLVIPCFVSARSIGRCS